MSCSGWFAGVSRGARISKLEPRCNVAPTEHAGALAPLSSLASLSVQHLEDVLCSCARTDHPVAPRNLLLFPIPTVCWTDDQPPPELYPSTTIFTAAPSPFRCLCQHQATSNRGRLQRESYLGDFQSRSLEKDVNTKGPALDFESKGRLVVALTWLPKRHRS